MYETISHRLFIKEICIGNIDEIKDYVISELPSQNIDIISLYSI